MAKRAAKAGAIARNLAPSCGKIVPMSDLPPTAALPPNEPAAARQLWRISGADALTFLQGLVTNDLRPLGAAPGLIWTALLTPQGKYLADFFVLRRLDDPSNTLFLDLHADQAATVTRLIQLYKLRADVQLAASPLEVRREIDEPPHTAAGDGLSTFPDPRHPALGVRVYGQNLPPEAPDLAARYQTLRLANRVPEFPSDLTPNDSYILEFDFERLHGVDFRKGCYVGQEVTARMKHKTELRKGLVRLEILGAAAPGTPITLADGREAGRLGTNAQGQALAWMRFDRMTEALYAGEARLSAPPPSPEA